jgi:hypothetical protein
MPPQDLFILPYPVVWFPTMDKRPHYLLPSDLLFFLALTSTTSITFIYGGRGYVVTFSAAVEGKNSVALKAVRRLSCDGVEHTIRSFILYHQRPVPDTQESHLVHNRQLLWISYTG